MIRQIGVQLFTVRDTMDTAENIRNTFKKLRELGYEHGQTAGCRIPYTEFGQIAREEGIEICGTHDSFELMVNDIELAIANHKSLGTANMGIGGWRAPNGTVEEIERFIEQVNAIAARAYEDGMKFTYHNHSQEFIRLANGKTMMDMLAEGLDPKKTSFVLDTYWVQHGGGDVRHWIEKLTGRIDILHLKDMGRNEKGPVITEIGSGNLWWPGIVEAAEKAGVRYYVVEQDTCPGDPFDSLKKSADYIKTSLMQ